MVFYDGSSHRTITVYKEGEKPVTGVCAWAVKAFSNDYISMLKYVFMPAQPENNRSQNPGMCENTLIKDIQNNSPGKAYVTI
jgi:hypothetical protein